MYQNSICRLKCFYGTCSWRSYLSLLSHSCFLASLQSGPSFRKYYRTFAQVAVCSFMVSHVREEVAKYIWPHLMKFFFKLWDKKVRTLNWLICLSPTLINIELLKHSLTFARIYTMSCLAFTIFKSLVIHLLILDGVIMSSVFQSTAKPSMVIGETVPYFKSNHISNSTDVFLLEG